MVVAVYHAALDNRVRNTHTHTNKIQLVVTYEFVNVDFTSASLLTQYCEYNSIDFFPNTNISAACCVLKSVNTVALTE